eukprot:TRINITY_DN93152_c0_g1_i1.p1 TRINITY_DN93152_c0_g1~~TRINITY_DN93152_c0_g1_i1.p1  ORF type:complete len:1369 (+),score=308.95 TRINITY_DN93152_c0_g1_i1:82-4188(+)
MADVDDIWAEMQKEQLGLGTKTTKAKVVKTVDLSSLQRERAKPKKALPKKQLDSTLGWMHGWSSTVKQPSGSAGYPGLAASEDLSQLEPPTTLIDVVEDLPSGTPETFLAYLQRDINCLGEEQLGVRLQSIQKLERILVKQVDSLSTDTVDAVCDALLKPLLKRTKDKSEKIRELAVNILRSLVENASHLGGLLAYIFPTLVARLGSEDLDGVAHLPEIMRPDPEQKPVEIARPVEESEEVRLSLHRFVTSLLARLNPTQIYSYVDEATGLLRAGCMDPFPEVKAMACETMIAFCYNNTEMLLHFALPMARSLTSCLTHNHAKVRILALRGITALLWCGVWKHNFEIFQVLMAWQDPNKVPIKAFYEGHTQVNYMSTLSFDRHPAVRRFWFETLANWLLTVPDKVDHEPYVFPYLLTGLCDENEDIALEVFWLIERCGQLYESEHEEDLRKTKQYGFDYSWTYNGRATVPFPLQGLWSGGKAVSSHVRRTTAQGPDYIGKKGLDELRKHRDALDDLPDEPLREDELDDLDEDDEVDAKLGRAVPLPEREYCWPILRDLKVFRRLPRPRLGSRHWIRTHTRRYIKATFNDVVDFRDCTTLNAGRLLCMSIAYTEEGVTEWLQPMMAALTKFYSGRAWASGQKDQAQTMETYSTVCRLCGAFLDPVAVWAQLRCSLDPDSLLDLDQRVAMVRILALCLQGHVEVLQSIENPDPDLGLGHLESVMPELVSAVYESDLLLSPTPESRAALWDLVFSFLEPLRPWLTSEQVSKLLFVVLSLSAKPPPDEASELPDARRRVDPTVALQNGVQLLDLEEEELLDRGKLERALDALCKGIEVSGSVPQQACGGFSLDSLDDGDDDFASPSSASEEAKGPLQVLFDQAFLEVMERLDDSFQVFRSVVYLSPLSVLVSASHVEVILRRLEVFCDATSTSSTRSAAQALGVQLAVRCSKIAESDSQSSLARSARYFIWKVFQMLGRVQLGALQGSFQNLSYAVAMSGLAMWRRFYLSPHVDPRLALFPPSDADAEEKTSPCIEFMVAILADQELYKRFAGALELCETTMTGKAKEDFVVAKARRLREESDRRASAARAMAASTLLLVLRSMCLDGRGSALPWLPGSKAGSTSMLFRGVASLFRVAQPTLDPPFVRPTAPGMYIYVGEMLHVLMHLPKDAKDEDSVKEIAQSPLRIVDDAARAITQLTAPPSVPRWPPGLKFSADEEDELVVNFVQALIDLNLSLPPDPNAKHAPASLDQAGGDILIGWEDALLSSTSAATSSGSSGSSDKAGAAAVPSEVIRIQAQSPECLTWNAALALYKFGIDLTVVCPDGFQKAMAKWRKKGEQGKVIVAQDIINRAQKAYTSSYMAKMALPQKAS